MYFSRQISLPITSTNFTLSIFYSGWFSRTELTIPSPTVKINDGEWHSIKIHRVRQSIDVEIDGEVYNSRVTGSYYELNTANSVLLGM